MIQNPGNTYQQKVMKHLSDIEETILDFDKNPGNKEYINRLFHAIHAIKVLGSMFGFDEIAGFTHHLETVIDHVRQEKIEFTNKLIDLTLASRDHIKAMINDEKEPLPNEIESRCEIISQLQNLLPGSVKNEGVFEKFCQDIFNIPEINPDEPDK